MELAQQEDVSAVIWQMDSAAGDLMSIAGEYYALVVAQLPKLSAAQVGRCGFWQGGRLPLHGSVCRQYSRSVARSDFNSVLAEYVNYLLCTYTSDADVDVDISLTLTSMRDPEIEAGLLWGAKAAA
jgi:hypothetical protein